MSEADPIPVTGPHKRRNTDRGWRRIVRENGYRDLWLLLVSVLALAAILIGNHENHDRINDIQRERARALTLICEQTNVHNSAIVGFVRASVPRARLHDPRVQAYLKAAEATFPQADCAVVVANSVKPNP